MTIVRIESAGPVALAAEPFSLEKHLEDAVASFPNLLAMSEEPGLALVRQQVGLLDAGVLDLLLVVRSGGRASGPTNVPEKKMSDELSAVVSAYNASASAGLAAVGRAHNYRQIRPQGWPGGMHYELLQYTDSIGVELHMESPACVPIAGIVEGLARKADPPFRMEWSPKWQGGPGRLMSRIPLTQPPDAIAAAMRKLIAFSFEDVNNALRGGHRAEPAQRPAAPDGAPSLIPLGAAPRG